MRSNSRMIAAAAFVVFFMGALPARGSGVATSAPGANNSKSTDSTSISAIEPTAPMPEGRMAAMPYSGGASLDVPRFDLFLGYSYVHSVPTLDAGNRLVWLNGGSTSLAVNLNRHLSLVGDFGGFNDSELRLSTASPSTVSAAALTFADAATC